MTTAHNRIQIGAEATRGTGVAADIVLLGRLTMTPEITWSMPEDEERNSLALLHRQTNVGQQASLSFEGIMTFQQLIYLLDMGIGAVTTTRPDSGGNPTVYDHVFEPTLTALAVANSYTIEYGDGQQEYESVFCMASELSFSFAMGESWQMGAEIFGNFPAKSTFTGALTAPTVEEVIGQKTKIYMDTTWSGVGTTQVSASLISASIRIPTGFGPTRYADGGLEFGAVAESKRAAEIELVFKHNASGEAEYDKFAAGTLMFLQLVIQGSTAGASLIFTVTFDFSMRYTEAPELFTEQDGENVIRLSGRAYHDPTSGRDMRITVRNTTVAVS
jgi:hypothetical protein